MMYRILGLMILMIMMISCKGQSSTDADINVGGPCEDCIAALDYKLLGKDPKSSLTLSGYETTNPKLNITGTVYKSDGKTPAKDIIIYVYQTNRNGLYVAGYNPIGWEKRHGKVRGWVKSDFNGKFSFRTFRPAAYPEGQEAEHIHIYIKEPGKIAYYIDSYTFDDDTLLTLKKRQTQVNRGGSGIIKLTEKDGILLGKRDIILGLNIPNYIN